MARQLSKTLSGIFTCAALLAFLIAGGTFDHALADTGHAHIHDVANDSDHAHARTGDKGLPDADLDPVHCGANLLTLTSEPETGLTLVTEIPEHTGPCRAVSKTTTVDPPPPRIFS